MANETYSFEIAAEVAKARKEIAAFAKETQRQLDGIKSDGSTTALATGFLAVKDIATGAFRTISGVVNTAISESLEAEKANIQLANSMKLVGDFTQIALDEFDDYATTLSKTSEATDDQIKASLALAKSFTLTNEEAKRVVTAATELSAVTGDSLNSSVEKLAKTFNGTISKELKQIIPELRTFTEEQLRSGDAVDAVANRFKGSASVINNSFGGALNQLSKSFSNLAEETGNSITQNNLFKSSIELTTSAVDGLSAVIKNGLAKSYNDFFKSIEDRASLPVLLGFSDAKKEAEDLKKINSELSEEFKRLREKGKVGESSIQQIRNDNAAREKALEELNKIRSQLELSGLTDIEKINKEAADKIKTIRAAINTGAVNNSKEIQKQIAGIEIDRIKKVSEFEKREAEKRKAELEKIRSENAAFASDAAGAVTGAIIQGKQITDQQGAAAGAGFIKEVLKGADGAKQVVSSAIGAVANAIVPGIGPVVSEIINVLSQGPDKVREMVRGFAKAIPEIIKNLTESLPVLIEELARELPPALARAMPLVANSFAIELIKNMPSIVRGFAEGLVDAAKQFVQAIIDQVKSVGGLFGGGSDGGGGLLSKIPVLGDIIGGIGDIFGFADGGRISDSPSLANDAVIARVGAGEQILGKDLSSQLEAFLSGQNQSQPIVINLTVGQSQLARAILDLNRGGFRTS